MFIKTFKRHSYGKIITYGIDADMIGKNNFNKKDIKETIEKLAGTLNRTIMVGASLRGKTNVLLNKIKLLPLDNPELQRKKYRTIREHWP